jgi:nucleotide-binding universal stress UspA family protein
MIRSIAVPLDGSSLAGSALPFAISIARRLGVRTLETMTVYTPTGDPLRASGAPVRDTRFDHELLASVRAFAADLERRFSELAPDLAIKATVLEGPVADTLAEHLARGEHDLVVMTTHGHSGISRLWLGSVADRLVRHSPIPVLLLKDLSATVPGEGAPLFSDVLVPVDVNEESEEILSDAIALAGADATYHLLHVVVPPRRVPPPPAYDVVTASQLARGFPPDPHSANRDAAEQHVEALAESLRSRGLRVSTRVEIHQNPAEVILASAADSNVGLIAMASRGRGAARRLLLGGVTDKVVRGATVPVLVRVPSATRP